MVKDMSYNTISRVLESWEVARSMPDFEENVGTLALLKLFELEPRTKEVFGFSKDYNPDKQELKEPGNLFHGIRMIHMFDAAFNMLGPDTETLDEILTDIAKRHIVYGVKPHYFPFMGQAVVYALKQTIGKHMTPEVTEAWVEVYDGLSGAIMKSIFNHS